VMRWAGVIMACVLAFGCGGEAPPAGGSSGAAPAAAPPASQTAKAPEGPAPKTVADIFPPGDGRELVMNSCASCHNVACAAIGQRTPERWDALKVSHKEHASGVNLDVVFNYLKANFNDAKPQPNVPPQFLEGGCTPF
jgi:mono/diheme cytochrome c family protein